MLVTLAGDHRGGNRARFTDDSGAQWVENVVCQSRRTMVEALAGGLPFAHVMVVFSRIGNQNIQLNQCYMALNVVVESPLHPLEYLERLHNSDSGNGQSDGYGLID
jgi:hypothetical protein